MITKTGPRVLEYNVRFGDPETQSLLSLMDSDLAQVIEACANGKLDQVDLKVSSKSAATVVMAAGGYPGSYKSGVKIEIESSLPESKSRLFAGLHDTDCDRCLSVPCRNQNG
jgi:phosphoribosylamine-glycine ligase